MSERPPTTSNESPDDTIAIPRGSKKNIPETDEERRNRLLAQLEEIERTFPAPTKNEVDPEEAMQTIRRAQKRYSELFARCDITGEDADIIWKLKNIHTGNEFFMSPLPQNISNLAFVGVELTPNAREKLRQKGLLPEEAWG